MQAKVCVIDIIQKVSWNIKIEYGNSNVVTYHVYLRNQFIKDITSMRNEINKLVTDTRAFLGLTSLSFHLAFSSVGHEAILSPRLSAHVTLARLRVEGRQATEPAIGSRKIQNGRRGVDRYDARAGKRAFPGI